MNGSPSISPCSIHESGRTLRGYEITCGKCGVEERLKYNYTKHLAEDNIIERNVELKFECKGWKVGRRKRDNRCPDCLRRATQMRYFHAQKKEDKMKKENSVTVNEVLSVNDLKSSTAMLKLPDPPMLKEEERAMTVPDRYLVINKLMEAYTVGQGYNGDWDDQKVAMDLGVPLSWVEKLRDENFGPLVTADMVEVQEWRKTADRLVDAIQTFNDEYAKPLQAAKDVLQAAKDATTKLAHTIDTFAKEAERLKVEANRLVVKGETLDRKMTRRTH